MKNILLFTLATFLIFAMMGVSSARQDKPDGKSIFIEKKCNGCHSIEAAAIVKKTATSAKQGPPDLSSVGSLVQPGFISRFLMKEDTLHGKKHLLKFGGSEDELKVLAQWLESLKASADSTSKAPSDSTKK